MSGRELDQHVLALNVIDPDEWAETERGAAKHCADRIAAEHPHEHDDSAPELAGRALGKDPVIAAELLELLDAIGYLDTRRTA
ncbi:MAG: hypothetical protein HOY79_01025 [Streptomyces sp.]|nr:hypothetical protein [Streptomyces sp.]